MACRNRPGRPEDLLKVKFETRLHNRLHCSRLEHVPADGVLLQYTHYSATPQPPMQYASYNLHNRQAPVQHSGPLFKRTGANRANPQAYTFC